MVLWVGECAASQNPTNLFTQFKHSVQRVEALMLKDRELKRVAVVGAGLAGLTCARSLSEAGVQAVVYEKSRGVGGRLATRRADWAHYDHGAQYFTVRDPQFASFLTPLQAAGHVERWEPSMAQPIDEPWYVACPGMSSLARLQSQGLEVVFEQRVMALVPEAHQWRLQFEDTAKPLDAGRFDAVVLAVPNEQAVPLIQAWQPEWADRLSQTPMQPCWTVLLSTAALDVPWQAGSPSDSPIGWWARNDTKPGRPAREGQFDWVIQATPAWTQQHLNADKSLVTTRLVAELFHCLGVAAPTVLAQPMAHRWLYARRQSGLSGYPEGLWSAVSGIGVCGDGLTHSRVENAYLSGWRLAQQMLGA
jgi:predicted NAD/FAD-dependent oxidoreductase